jgi:hypothetical protein
MLAKKHSKAISDYILRLDTAKYFINKHDSGLFVYWAKEYNQACDGLMSQYGIHVEQYDLTNLERLQND